jgi:Ca2+-binding RTX toxin-like protein
MATNLTDGTGYLWDIQTNGNISNGTSDAYDGGLVFSGYSPATPEATEDGGREVVTAATTVDTHFSVKRKIYVPGSGTRGYARFLEIITNNSTSAQSYSLILNTNLGSDSSTQLIRTSSGDATLGATDRWMITDDADASGDPSMAHIFANNQGNVKPAVTVPSTGNIQYQYDLSFNPGETKIVMHFASQNPDQATAISTAQWLAGIPTEVLSGMSAAEKNQVVNFALSATPPPPPPTTTSIDGTAAADILLGTESGDLMNGDAGNDYLAGQAGADTINGGQGNDIIAGGLGNDELSGDADAVAAGITEQTTSAQKAIPNTNQTLAISLTAPDASNDTAITVSGFVAPNKGVISGGNDFNIAFIVDVSGSTGGTFSGNSTIADLNNDGTSNTILDAEIAGVRALFNSLVNRAGLAGADVALIPFQSSASISYQGVAGEDQNNNNVKDLIDGLYALNDSGGTNFENAMRQAITYFNGAGSGKNVLYFLSDGSASASAASDEVSTLLNAAGINATINTFGVGSGANMSSLDLLDDGLSNNSATQTLDPSRLSVALTNSGITRADVARVELFLNGNKVKTIQSSALTVTPFGLRYNTTISGLKPGDADRIVARVVATDAASTALQTAQTVETQNATGGNDVIIGGNGADTLYGSYGNDTLIGGYGRDDLDGGNGFDFAGYRDAPRGVVANLANPGQNTGIAAGDTYASIEGLKGSRFADKLVGNGAINQLVGNNGNDTLLGNGGNDVLYGNDGRDTLQGNAGKDLLVGGDGNDRLTGGTQADKFRILNASSGMDTLTDFNRSQGDKVQVVSRNFRNLARGTLASGRFVANSSGLAQDSNDYFVFNTANKTLYFDRDGQGGQAGVAIAKLSNGVNLRNTDIVLV